MLLNDCSIKINENCDKLDAHFDLFPKQSRLSFTSFTHAPGSEREPSIRVNVTPLTALIDLINILRFYEQQQNNSTTLPTKEYWIRRTLVSDKVEVFMDLVNRQTLDQP